MARTKFPVVQHYARGQLSPDDYFVLVPDRDPAAVMACRAYAKATPDTLLAAELTSWCDRIEGVNAEPIGPVDMGVIYLWASVLAKEVHAGRMEIETALQRIAGHTAAWMRDETTE